MSSKAEVEKKLRIEQLMHESEWHFVHFKGGHLMSGPGTRGFIPFDKRKFGALCQSLFPGITENMINDFAKTVMTLAPDWSEYDNFMAFGTKLWDTKKLDWDEDQLEYVYSSRIEPSQNIEKVNTFLTQLAGGDEELAHDMLQALAPLVMHRKPAGVIWFVGDGANGKSSLINLVYRLFGPHLASVTTAALEDGRAAPTLNGMLGNIVREASEARVEDTERYKAIGTHEPFQVREYYSQNMLTVDTNLHTVFNANNVPVFSDKTRGARRRTLIVPFPAHFEDNPNFEDETFTEDFCGAFITLLIRAAREIKDNNYRYKWGDAVTRAKDAYDSEVNSAEAFIEHLKEVGVVAFTNFQMLRFNYESFCGENGLVPLGITTLKRTLTTTVGATRRTFRVGANKRATRYVFLTNLEDNITWFDNGLGATEASEQGLAVPVKSTEQLEAGW